MHMHTHIAAPTGARTRFAALGAAILAAVGLSLAAASPALAHDELLGVAAVGDAATGEAPGIRLSFSNEIMGIGTEIIVSGAAGTSGADAVDGAPVVEGRDVTQRLVADVIDGDYTLAWRVVSSDGHPIQGRFAFSVVDGFVDEIGPNAAIGAAESDDKGGAEEDDHAEHSHGDEQPTAISAESGGVSTGEIVALVVIVLVVAGAVAAVSIGAKRRRQAIEHEIESGSGDAE